MIDLKKITIIQKVQSQQFNLVIESQEDFALDQIAVVASGDECDQFSLCCKSLTLNSIKWKGISFPPDAIKELNIDIGPIRGDNGDNFILLRGSLVLNMNIVDINEIAYLWPTKDVKHLKKIHIEPAGLYIEGTLPGAFFEDSEERNVLLRVLKVSQDSEPEWTLEPISLNATDKFDASEFIKNYAEAFRIAETDGFLNNLICRPDPKCSVNIKRLRPSDESSTGDFLEMAWEAAGLGTRIMIGRGRGPEAVFFPDRLEGSVYKENGSYERLESVCYASGKKNREDVDISISAENFIINNQVFVSLSVPAFPLAGEVDSSQDSRSWLCTKTGWLSQDFTSTKPEFDFGDISKSTLRGAIDVNDLLDKSDGLHLKLTALGKRKNYCGSFVALEMEYMDQKKKLTLSLQDVLAVFTTPNVWLNPIAEEEGSKKSILPNDLKGYNPNLIPAIPWSLKVDAPNGDRKTLLEAELRPIFSEGIFVSKNAIKSSHNSGLLSCSIFLEDEKFIMKFSGQHARIWHRPTGYPLVQSHPLSQSDNNTLILDPNRGLIPFQPDKEAFCRLDFSESGLPAITVQEKIPQNRERLWIEKPENLCVNGPHLIKWTLPPGDVKNIKLLYLFGAKFNEEKEICSYDYAVTKHCWIKGRRVTIGNNWAKLRLEVTFTDGKKNSADSENFKIFACSRKADRCEESVANGKVNEIQSTEIQIPDPIPSEQWLIPNDFHSMRLFLPTLPGVEVTMSGTKNPIWVYRHSVPALDQAYAEATQALSSYEGSAFSRVKGTEAFEIDSKSKEVEASGWIHKTEKNKTGSINIKIITSEDDLKGLNPVLSFNDISNTISPKLGRKHEKSGLNGVYLDVDVKPTIIPEANLPDFKVNFSRDPKTEEIVFEGQPLIVRSMDSGQAVVLDGEGLVQSEQIPGKTWFRPLGKQECLVLPRRLLLGKTEFGDKMVLELTGVSMENKPDYFNYERECWQLHDGDCGWPLLRGFPLCPLKLSISSDPKSITIQAILMPRIPEEDASRPHFAMGVVELKFNLPDDLYDMSPLALTSIEGDIDWRWRTDECTENGDRGVQLQRLKANLSAICEQGEGCPDVFEPFIEELTLDLPIGPISISQDRNSPISCKLTNGILEFNISKKDDNSFRYKLRQIIKANVACEPLESGCISWGFEDMGEHIFYLKLLVKKDCSHEWWLSLSTKAKNDDLLNIEIERHKIGRNRYLFNAKEENIEPVSLGWWKMIPLNCILGFEHHPPETRINSPCLELLLEFKDSFDSQFMGVIRSRNKNRLSLEVTGSMKFRNNINFVKNGTSLNHNIELFIHNAEIPVECILSGKGPSDDLFFGAVASHTIKEGSMKWQLPQIVRLTTIERANLVGTDPRAFPKDAEQDLVIDLSSVFWLKRLSRAPVLGASSQTVVESPSIRMILKSRETSSFQDGAFLIRLPAAVWKSGSGDQAAPLVVNLKDKRDAENRTSGIQPEINQSTIKLINRLNEMGNDIAYILRTPNASWLNSGFICSALKPDPNGDDFNSIKCNWPGLSPCFNCGASKLPLGDQNSIEDLWWLEADGGPLAAATLSCKHHQNSGAQILTGPTLFEFPFEVSTTTPNEESISVSDYYQLIYFDQGILRRLAHKSTVAGANDEANKSDNEADQIAIEWAKAILKEKSILDSAFLLVDFKRILFLPGIIPEDLSYSKFWPMDAPIGEDPDPRCRHPTRLFRDIAPIPSLISTYSSEESLGFMVYQAHPVKISDDSCVEGGASATRFRLVSTSGPEKDELKFQGKLRPAKSCEAQGVRDNDENMYIASGKVIAISNREELEFEPYDHDPKYPYPRPNPRPLREMPMLFDMKEDCSLKPVETILPPRLDAISWSARPGEMVRSDWHLRCNTLGICHETGKKHLKINASRPFSIALRRPRADAGNCSSIRLETIADPIYIMNNQFYHAHFILKQTINMTAPPNSDEMHLALVTKSNVHIGSPQPDRDAKVNLINPDARSLEDLGIYLIANSGFKPSEEERVVLVAQKLESTGKVESVCKLPNLNQNGDLISDGSNTYKLINFVHSNEANNFGLKFPPNDGWEQVTESSYAFEIPEAKKTFEVFIDGWEGKNLHLRLAKYIKNSDNSEQQYKCNKVLAHLYINLIKANSVSLSGRYSVSLISYPTDENKNAVLAGYTRLGADDFSLVRPGKKDEQSSLIYWFKAADLMLLDRMAWMAEAKIGFDAVVYGPGGELIPNE